MAHINVHQAKVQGGIPLSFTPGYTGAEAPTGPGAVTQRSTPYGGFTLTLASPPEAEGLSIDYVVEQDGAEVSRATTELAFSGKFDKEGKKLWNLLSMPVPQGAQVRFKVRYRMGKKSLVDDNEGKGYLATVE